MTNDTTIDSYVNTSGRFLDSAEQLDLNTIKHSRDIQKDRLTDYDSRFTCFRTGDFSLYTTENDNVVLYIADRENNLILKNLNDAVSQIKKNGNYLPKDSDIGAVISSASTLKTNLSDLHLKDHSGEWSYFEIDVNNPDSMNPAQRAVAEKAFGFGDDFKNTMKMFQEAEVTTTRVYTLNPNHVKNTLKENNATSLARDSLLQSLDSNSCFIAGDGDMEYGNRSFCGLPSKN